MPEPEDLQIELFDGGRERKGGRAGGRAASRRRTVLEVLDKNLRSIWEGDVDLYRATTADELADQFRAALAEPGPHLIDATLPAWSPV